MALTLEQAKKLEYNQVLYHRINRNADGSAQRWRVVGKPKTWKTMPERVEVPLRFGMKLTTDHFTETDLDILCLHEWEALGRKITYKKWEPPCENRQTVYVGGEKMPGYVKKMEDGKWYLYFQTLGENHFGGIPFKTRKSAARQLAKMYCR